MLLALTTGWPPKSDFARVDIQLCRSTADGFLLVARNPKGKLCKNIWIRPFTVPELCPVRCLRAYLEMTTSKREHDPATLFFASTSKTKASPDTIGKWITTILYSVGIAAAAHSTRAAAASAASRAGIPLRRILDACDWTRASTFAAHYRRTTLPPTDLLAAVYKTAPLDDADASIEAVPTHPVRKFYRQGFNQ